MNMVRHSVYVMGMVILLLLGCGRQEQGNDAVVLEKKQEKNFFLNSQNIYIDSVPVGAHVYDAQGERNKPLNELGTTPLVLDSSLCQSRKFWIMMIMDEYVEKISVLPKLESWIKEIKTYSNKPPTMLFFDFLDTTVTQSAYTEDEGVLVATGPVLGLLPIQNRICVLFVPKGRNPYFLKPLMAPRGAFHLKEDKLEEVFINKYGFTAIQAKNAVELLSRCGRATVAVPGKSEKDKFTVYSLTCNGRGAKLPLIWQEWEWESGRVREAGLSSQE